MNKHTLADRLRQDFIAKDCERMHPELHEAVRKFWSRANMGEEITDSGVKFTTLQSMHSAQDEQEFLAAREAFRDRNAQRIQVLQQQLDGMRAEMKALTPAIERIQQCRWQNEAQQRDGWKAIAKRLDIHKYLTANGSLSHAKMQKITHGDRAVMQAVIDTYNKRYITEVNAQRASAVIKTVSDQDRADAARYNELVTPVNDLSREINQLSGNLKTPRA